MYRYLSLDAATKVAFTGQRYLHGWLRTTFANVSDLSLQLVARAKRCGSFILMVGTLASPDTFEPKYATIVKDKDEFIIPLLVETIPTPKVRTFTCFFCRSMFVMLPAFSYFCINAWN